MRNGLFAISDDFPGKLPLAEGLPAKGIEPSHSCEYWILSPARLPVPPRRRRSKRVRNYKHQPKAQELPIRSESTARKLSGGAKISRRTMASRKPVGQAPQEICECALRPIPLAHAESAEASMSIFAATRLHFCSFYSPLALAAETKARLRRTRGKADFRNVLRSWRIVKSLHRISIHKFRITNHVPSVRGLSEPAIDSRIVVSACTFFIR